MSVDTSTSPILLAGHIALDLLNTLPRIDGQLVDYFQTDADVRSWLAAVGEDSPAADPLPASSLLTAARHLRESVRQLIEDRKAGRRGNPAAFNTFLAKAPSPLQLAWGKTGEIAVERARPRQTAEQWLAPVAEAAARLLAEENFELVKCCEDQSCVLWFHDLTKSHHRRWCSMATCGNRHKVAAYRKRSAER